jgi:hypothetical protein
MKRRYTETPELIARKLTSKCWILAMIAWPGIVLPLARGTETESDVPRYEIVRTDQPPRIDGKLDEPCWMAAPRLSRFRFTWYERGAQEQTLVKLLWDDDNIYLAHICQDAHITARHKNHDDPVPEDDCFEIMLAPDASRENNYYNIEWNVLGAYVDGHRPAGPKGARQPWDVQGLRMAGAFAGTLNEDSDHDQHWIVEVAIPLRNFAKAMKHMPPQPGDQCRMNLNRHGGDTNFQYSQWSSGDTLVPAFHTPHRFGFVTFSSKTSPFDPPSVSQ